MTTKITKMTKIKKKWMVKAKSGDFAMLSKELHIDQVTARLLVNRNMTTLEQMRQYLYGDVTQLRSGRKMKGVVYGAELLSRKIQDGENIRIIGDYDIDGVTATTILYQGIQACNGKVSVAIPDRIEDGYGLNARLIRQAKEDGVHVIVTCDNGIAACDAICLAKELDMTVIVTDHHNVPYDLDEAGNKVYQTNPADVVIDPKQQDCQYPFKDICGAVVAYKFVEELLTCCNVESSMKEQLMKDLLMYAAIGTIGDIMDLTDENRLIVKEGLRRIRETDNIGMKALIQACRIEQKNVSAYHIGYVIGPCINASGRLKTAELAFLLLQSQKETESEALAGQLVQLNEERKQLTEKYTQQAVELVSNGSLKDDKVLVIYLPDCHESIAGIIAGRIREQFVKPTLVITKTKEGLKGSARSIEAYPMYDELTKVEDCFTKFGGHAMAAGFSLPENRLDELRRRLNEGCTLSEEDFIEKISIDMAMPMDYVTMPLIQEFELLRPYGKGNASPLFAQKDVEIVSLRIIGRERKFVKMKLRTEHGNYFDGILFQPPEEIKAFLTEKFGEECSAMIMEGKQTGSRISICYVPEINSYAGTHSIQIQIKDYC